MPTTPENLEGKEKDAITTHTSPFPLQDNKVEAVANITNKNRTQSNNNILYTALMYSVLMLDSFHCYLDVLTRIHCARLVSSSSSLTFRSLRLWLLGL